MTMPRCVVQLPGILNRFFQRITGTPARLALFVGLVYFLSSFFSTTIREVLPLPTEERTLRYRNNYWAVVSMPRILRGDEMHYLVMAHSISGDGDLLLSREYASVQRGGIEMGIYHRHRPASNIFQHFSRYKDFSLVGNHPAGLSALLAMLLWPLAGSAWMEPASIWVTIFWGVLGLAVFVRVLESLGVSWRETRNAALLVAFATPWWSYSRTLYTEVYIGTALLITLLATLRNRALWAIPFAALMAWFKYPALLLFFSLGTGEAVQRRWRNFVLCGIAGAATFLAVYLANRMLYSDTGWITRMDGDAAPARSVLRAGAPIAWRGGETLRNLRRLFTDMDKGLFPHCPLLLLGLAGLWQMRKTARRHFRVVCMFILPWFLLHLTYRFLMSGGSYTTRYMVPLVPLVLIGLPWFWQWVSTKRPAWRYASWVIVGFSLFNNVIAGIVPGVMFNREPWEAWYEVVLIMKAGFGALF